jgi:hypothetical protein
VLELLHLSSICMHAGSIGLLNAALCFNCFCYEVAFGVFFVF